MGGGPEFAVPAGVFGAVGEVGQFTGGDVPGDPAPVVFDDDNELVVDGDVDGEGVGVGAPVCR